jgi:carbamoyl-phosphate synthase small subunit
LKKLAANAPGMTGQNFIADVSCAKPYVWKKGLENFILGAGNVASQSGRAKIKRRFRVAAYDFGIKTNILRLLVESGCDVTVVPHAYPAEKLLDAKARYDGVFLSNGPGDPAACVEAVENVKKLLGKKPVFGICLGHQIIGLALGARTYKLKFGHHGANHPVMDLATRKVEITSQNHGFVVDDGTLPKDAEVTHLNLNDGTVEGLRHKVLPVFSVQYHPEAGPGPHDSRYLFERFTGMMGTPASAVASR